MKKIAIIIFLITSILGCKDMILKYKDVGNFQVETIQKDSSTYLHLTGLSLNSSLNIKEIREIREQNVVYIIITLTLSRNDINYSGSIDHYLQIDQNLNKVYFGEEKILIWENEY